MFCRCHADPPLGHAEHTRSFKRGESNLSLRLLIGPECRASVGSTAIICPQSGIKCELVHAHRQGELQVRRIPPLVWAQVAPFQVLAQQARGERVVVDLAFYI